MRLRASIASAMLGFAIIAGDAATAASPKAPVEWDGLRRVPSKRMDYVYLQPGADFRPYTKVIIQPTEVAFRKNWRRDYNSSSRDLGGRISERDEQDAITKGVAAATDMFVEAWRKGGYTVVDAPGPDVLVVKTAIANISVNAPEARTSARSYSFSEEAGRATLVIEARDSLTNALLGRAVDQKIAGDNGALRRTSVSNRMDFRDLAQSWASESVRGMDELKKLSPIE